MNTVLEIINNEEHKLKEDPSKMTRKIIFGPEAAVKSTVLENIRIVLICRNVLLLAKIFFPFLSCWPMFFLLLFLGSQHSHNVFLWYNGHRVVRGT